ncbi:hypothetical protein HZ993_02505 [Rhodoferax sp. AJA081-3]|uniref:hypothetical protein n=1 Tax=Rhodoferax sp. AJA081-3 TaxID=2752316 RepID=UPI001ADF1DEA|nr:hypothetical protein [Rhodoferax sp. AJA081-3]QTN28744.1 hypothetical protein HZ993_02505 [Rhodoferax sp. AJA081-3]
MKKLLAVVLCLLSVPSWGSLTVNITQTAATADPPGTFYTMSIPAVDQMKAAAPAGQRVYVFVGVMRAETAGKIPVDMLSLNTMDPHAVGAVSGYGVTATTYHFDPNAFTSAPVNVSNPNSTAGLSIATDQSTFTTTNVSTLLAGMQAGDAIWVVAGTGANATDALANGLLSGNTAEVFKKQLLLNAAPNLLSAGHTVGSTGCPQAMGTVNVTSLLAAGQVLNVSATSSNPVFRFANNTNASTFTVAAGTSTPVAVTFDCTMNPPQTGSITFIGSTAGVGHSHTVSVTVTLARN